MAWARARLLAARGSFTAGEQGASRLRANSSEHGVTRTERRGLALSVVAEQAGRRTRHAEKDVEDDVAVEPLVAELRLGPRAAGRPRGRRSGELQVTAGEVWGERETAGVQRVGNSIKKVRRKLDGGASNLAWLVNDRGVGGPNAGGMTCELDTGVDRFRGLRVHLAWSRSPSGRDDGRRTVGVPSSPVQDGDVLRRRARRCAGDRGPWRWPQRSRVCDRRRRAVQRRPSWRCRRQGSGPAGPVSRTAARVPALQRTVVSATKTSRVGRAARNASGSSIQSMM